MSRATSALVGIALACCFGLQGAGASAQTNVMFIFDASGSMKKQIETGETRFAAAQRAMTGILSGISGDVRLGLVLYGHRRAKDCTDIELVSPIGADNAASIARRINGLQAKGETPIAESLQQALRSFGAFRGQTNRVILVTDGIEECGGDPCAAAKAAIDAGVDVKVDVVGFTLNDEQRRTVQCIADTTGGRYLAANDAGELVDALKKTQVAEIPPPPPEPPKPVKLSLLSPKNGGQVVAVPSDVWLATADDAETEAQWLRTDEEGVYAFQDGRPATFDTFTVLINSAHPNNPKSIELLVGDEGPTGSFRPVATCNFQNIKLLQTIYQPCKFQPVTARYLKVKLGQSVSGDGYLRGTEFQLLGELADASDAPVAPPPAPTASRMNLLSPGSGGQIVAVPTDVWLATADDKEAEAQWLRTEEEGVYAFQDGRPATFDTFTVLISSTHPNNPKSIELLAGDDGATGPFRPVATCTFQNIKLVQTLYQPCKFEPVTARYLKVKLGQSASGDGYLRGTEFQLFGELGEGGGSAATPAPAPAMAKTNLLSPRNGGQLIAVPTDVWLTTADDKEVETQWLRTDEEAIYGFQDGRAATFDGFATLILGTHPNNPKSIELFAGDDPGGDFRPVATCAYQNVKLLQSPYQSCTFQPVTAHYLKLKMGQSVSGDGYVRGTEFQLFGELAP